MKRSAYDAKCYWELTAEMRSAEYAACAYTRYCVREELSFLSTQGAARIAELSSAALEASFIAEFGVAGAAAGRIEHERLSADNLTVLANVDDDAGADRAHGAWLKQFALIDRRLPTRSQLQPT